MVRAPRTLWGRGRNEQARVVAKSRYIFIFIPLPRPLPISNAVSPNTESLGFMGKASIPETPENDRLSVQAAVYPRR